jgi:polyketide biosynthesis 3-hydroxy-3-methylglutaryl-CoA synthase-like enzyme PksG
MRQVGIEAVSAYCGEAYLDVPALFRHRRLDTRRMDNLMMRRKSVALHCEDAVSFAVNAARPIVDALSEEERQGIELLIVGTESGVDFGKSVSTYVHDLLGLSRNCRMFEVKQACYSGTAGVQMAAAVVAASPFDGARALAIGTDVSRPVPHTYAEPSNGAGAVAVLVSDRPRVATIDHGAYGCYGYEVMDTFRPTPEAEAGDADLSLLTYIDCLQGAFTDYARRVDGADLVETLDLLAMHTPFPGMVKGAHRTVLRRLKRLSTALLEEDFERRVQPSIVYPSEVGNIYAGSVYLALASAIDNAVVDGERRVGLFSYGSGCASEFFSVVVDPASQRAVRATGLRADLASRYELSVEEYDEVLAVTAQLKFAMPDFTVDLDRFSHVLARQTALRPRLVLAGLSNYHREYVWLGGGTG